MCGKYPLVQPRTLADGPTSALLFKIVWLAPAATRKYFIWVAKDQ